MANQQADPYDAWRPMVIGPGHDGQNEPRTLVMAKRSPKSIFSAHCISTQVSPRSCVSDHTPKFDSSSSQTSGRSALSATMADLTQGSEYRLLLWIYEESPCPHPMYPPLAPSQPAVPQRLMTPMPGFYGSSWAAGLRKKELPHVGSFLAVLFKAPLLKVAHQGPFPKGNTSKTREWRLANAPGLLIIPTSAMLRSSHEPEGYDELLLTLTLALQPGW
jgi:hypothetical protein